MNRGPSRSCTTGRSGTGRRLNATSRQAMRAGIRPSTIWHMSGCSPPSTSFAASRGLVATTMAEARTTLPSRSRTPRTWPSPISTLSTLTLLTIRAPAPSAAYVVDGMPERPLHLLDEQLRTDEVQRRSVDEGTRESRHQPAQLRPTDILVQPTLHACVRQGLRFGSA